MSVNFPMPQELGAVRVFNFQSQVEDLVNKDLSTFYGGGRSSPFAKWLRKKKVLRRMLMKKMGEELDKGSRRAR